MATRREEEDWKRRARREDEREILGLSKRAELSWGINLSKALHEGVNNPSQPSPSQIFRIHNCWGVRPGGRITQGG